jgi:hypothetical protein
VSLRDRLVKLALFGVNQPVNPGALAKAVHWAESKPVDLVGRALGPLVGGAINAPIGLGKRVLFGRQNAFGALKGTNLAFRQGPGSVRPITMERYRAITSGAEPGYAKLVDGVPVERLTRSKGLIGLAREHPITTGLIGAAALAPKDTAVGQVLDIANPMSMVGMGLDGFKPNIGPTAEFQRLSNAGLSADNPFSRQSRQAWGVRNVPQPNLEPPSAAG